MTLICSESLVFGATCRKQFARRCSPCLALLIARSMPQKTEVGYDGLLGEMVIIYLGQLDQWPCFDFSRGERMKIFKTSGAIDTTDKETAITLVFPEPVQYVALAGFTNDHQNTYRFHFE